MLSSSLIIVNYNTADRAVRLVEQVAGVVNEVIVVDNASPNGNATKLTTVIAGCPNARLLALDENRGYGAGANAGARLASGEVIVVANADVEIDATALPRLIAALTEQGIGLAAPRFLNPDGNLQRSAHRRDPGLLSTIYDLCRPLAGLLFRLAPEWHPTLLPADAHRTSRDCAHVLGALMAVRRVAFDAVGGFDERFFLYREETDLCRRLRARGWRIRHVADAVAVHEGSASSPDDPPSVYRPPFLASHYLYIAKHRGPAVAALARLLGTASCIAWFLIGPRRSLARGPVRWHLGLGDRGGRN